MFTLHLSPHGNDQWNGILAEPNARMTDGPLASFEAARKRVRQMRDQHLVNGKVTVKVAPGRYPLANPLSFGTGDRNLYFIGDSEAGEVVLDGSVAIHKFEISEVNGRPCWITDVSALCHRRGIPRSLFSNGIRCPRSRYPKEGFLVIEDVPDTHPDDENFAGGASRFIVREGEFDPDWRNSNQIEAVVNHLWIEERMPVIDYDPKTRLLSSSARSIFALRNKSWMGDTPCANYYLENIFEKLSEPGEWYLDARTHLLYYLPREGETPENTEIRLAFLRQLVRIHGDLEGNDSIHDIHFEGITFAHTDWTPSEGWGRWWDPQTPEHTWRKRDSFCHFNEDNLSHVPNGTKGPIAAVPQAAHDLPGVVSFEAARDCSLTNCRFRGLGFYGIDVRSGCSHLLFGDNRFEDIGGGGIKIDGADVGGDPCGSTHHINVSDNSLLGCGQVFPSAVGIGILFANRCLVTHNEISHQPYSGISVGWTWGFEESATRENQIEYNHIHDIGLGRLSDMGGIYTLGVQPGTIIRGNHIHHIQGSHYGGWGIYLDEGSSFITVEQNVVHHTNSQCLHEHWGRSNVYRDNVFAFANTELIMLANEEMNLWVPYPPRGCLMLRNLFLTDGKACFKDPMGYLEEDILDSDLNVFWDTVRGENIILWDCAPWPGVQAQTQKWDLAKIRDRGLEKNSIVAEPGFQNHQDGWFRIDETSPIIRGRIRVLNTNTCGPRSPSEREPNFAESYRPLGEIQYSD